MDNTEPIRGSTLVNYGSHSGTSEIVNVYYKSSIGSNDFK